MTARVCLASTVVFLLALSPGCVQSEACTGIWCSDQASVAIHRADWMMVSLAAEVEIDGRKVVCPVPDPQQIGGPCDKDVSIAVRQLVDCHETSSGSSRTQTCNPNGRFEQVITIRGTPAQVGVTLKSGAAVVGQRTFQLTYTSSRPNGPGCDPLCKQSGQTWELAGQGADGGGGDVVDASAEASADARADAAVDAPSDTHPDAGTANDAPEDVATIDSLADGPTCGTMTCAGDEVCVRVQVLGGACFQPEDGGCPAGYSSGGPCCVADPSFHCAARPTACGSTLTCACAGSLCTSGYTCAPRANEIDCTLLAP
jgi:hypothetical protein